MLITARELIDKLRLLSEDERIEAKRASNVHESIMETICAFANEPNLGGGYLILGVDEDKMTLFPSYIVRGITHVDKIINDLVSQCNTIFNVPLRPRVTQEEVEGKVVLKVFIDEVASTAKPVYFKRQGLPQGAFRRIGASDVRCTDDDLSIFYDGRT